MLCWCQVRCSKTKTLGSLVYLLELWTAQGTLIWCLPLFISYCQKCAESKYWLKYTAYVDLGIMLMNVCIPYVYVSLICVYIVVLCISMIYINPNNFIQVTKPSHRERKIEVTQLFEHSVKLSILSEALGNHIWTCASSYTSPPPYLTPLTTTTPPLQNTQHSFWTVSQ